MRGDLKCPRGHGIKVMVNRVGGAGCVAGVLFALAVRGVGGGVLVFFFVGSLLFLGFWIVELPLGRDRIVSSESHVACHVTSKGGARMGVSSSSGHTRERCFGVRPLLMCWQRCFAVRRSVLIWLT